MKNTAEVISYDNITDVDNEGFSYDGNRVWFKDCETEMLLTEGAQWTKYVGWREDCSRPPHFEFAAPSKHVVVTFPENTFWNRIFNDNKFTEFQFKLRELGWQTIDLG